MENIEYRKERITFFLEVGYQEAVDGDPKLAARLLRRAQRQLRQLTRQVRSLPRRPPAID
jgi:CRP-like cAMP-binding protein